MQDSQYLEGLLTSTIEGRDLEKVVRWGKWTKDWYGDGNYRTPKTGNFYISERYSEIQIFKTPTGKWAVTVKTKAQLNLGEYDTAEECLRVIWTYLIIKNGIPKGAKQKDYTKWLLDPNCPVWGKALNKVQIDEEYIKELRSSAGASKVQSLTDLFASNEWQNKFDFLGLKPDRKEKSFSIHYSKYNVDLNNLFILFCQSIDPDFLSKNKVRVAVELSNTKTFKSKISSFGSVEITIGDDSLEIIENKVMNRFLKELDKYQDNPIMKAISSILRGSGSEIETMYTVIKFAAAEVEKEPSFLAKVPDNIRSRVAAEAGFSAGEADAIKNSSDFGIV